LERQLNRVKWLKRNMSKLKCSRNSLQSWTDVRNYTRERWNKIFIALSVILIAFVLAMAASFM